MYLIITVVMLGIALLIRFVIRPAVRSARAAADLSQFQHHLAALATPFALTARETVTLSFVARDLGAIRNVAGESPTEDSYPASFPLVFATSERLVVLMSTTDHPTAISGIYPARQPNLRFRIGEQFDGATGGSVSSASWRWETVGMVVAEEREVGLSWTDGQGVGVVLLSFMDTSDQSRFVMQATAAIRGCRASSVLLPADPETTVEGAQTTFTFDKPMIICSRCSTAVADGERFCTGCGARVARMEDA